MTGVIITLVDVSHDAWRELHIQFPNAIRVPAGGGLTVVEAKDSTEALRVLAYAFPDLREVNVSEIFLHSAPTAVRPEGWYDERTGLISGPMPEAPPDFFEHPRGMAEPTRVFTFGAGHRHPLTSESLGGRYVRVPGGPEMARHRMLSVFGREWSHEYADLTAASRDGQFKLNPISPRPEWTKTNQGSGWAVSWVD